MSTGDGDFFYVKSGSSRVGELIVGEYLLLVSSHVSQMSDSAIDSLKVIHT